MSIGLVILGAVLWSIRKDASKPRPFQVTEEQLAGLQRRRADLMQGHDEQADQNPLILALEELDKIYHEGDHLATLFQCKDPKLPTLAEADVWNKKAVAFVRRRIFQDYISAKDWATFNERWSLADCQRIERLIRTSGYREGTTDAQYAVLRYLWGRVKRLGELLSKIKATNPEDNRTPIERITDFVESAQDLIDIFSTLEPYPPYAGLNEWVEHVREFLRRTLPEYVDGFNDVIRNPHEPVAAWPSHFDSEDEHVAWVNDAKRRRAWDVLNGAVRYLCKIVSDLRAKQPL